MLVAQPSGATLSVGMLTGVGYGVCGNTPGEHLGYGGIGWTATLVWARLRLASRVLVFLGRAGWFLPSTPIRLELVGTDGTDGREIMNAKSSAVSADPVAVAVRSLHAMVMGIEPISTPCTTPRAADRSRDGLATRWDSADAGLPVQDGVGEAAR